MNYWMMWVELKILIGNLFLSYHYLQDWSQEKAKVLITYHNQVREYRISVQQIEIMVLFVM